jgi:hypothetical protein
MKQAGDIVSIEGGMQIDRSDSQHSNADLLRAETLKLEANLTHVTDWQQLKQLADID